MVDTFKLFDVVALTTDLPDDGLYRGQVGTIVEIYSPDVFEVEFVEHNTDYTYALNTVKSSQAMLLHYAPVEKSST
ncbi:MAG: DUF4926 domain-containing protein [Anaerolineae bacterium]|nr:DUF4926 domain-containing protein [Anaerolineae bacterium]